jgi:hypothetical protein
MKPKKGKFSFGPGGIKGFFLEHVEKMVLGLVLVVVVLFVYFGSTVETFPDTKTPATLQQTVARANTAMETKSWEKVKETILPPPIDNPIVIRVSEKDFPLRTMDERILPSRTKRRDPDLYPPINLEVETMVAAVAMLPNEEEIAPIDLRYEEMIERQQAPLEPEEPLTTKKKKKKSRESESDLLGDTARGMGALGGLKTPRQFSEEDREELMRNGARASTQAIAHSRNIISLKALIPYQKQLLEYQEALAGNPQYVNEERDTPSYVFFKVERADVTADPTADPKTLKWVLLSTVSARNLPYIEKAQWETIPEELVDPAAVIAATERFGALTLPVPPALLVDLRKLAGHAEIDWASTLSEAAYGTDGKKTDDKKGTTEEGPDAAMEGPEGPEVEGPGMLGPGIRPTPGMRGEGRGGGMIRGPSGRGGYDGSSTSQEVVYKLFRFIDFDVEREHQYRYRVSVMLEDPNHPQLPAAGAGVATSRDGSGGGIGNDPPVASLDKVVEERLRELKKEEDKTGKRKWYRETEFSEASPIITVPTPLQFVSGNVSAAREIPIAGTFARVAAGEATAKTLVVQWDDEYATNVVAEEEVQRGTTVNFTKDAEALHPIKLEYVELKDYPIQTDALVVDIRGGDRLPGGTATNPQNSPGEVALIDHSGRLIVINEANDIKAWHRYGKVEPIRIEEPKPEDSPSSGERDLLPTRPRSNRR